MKTSSLSILALLSVLAISSPVPAADASPRNLRAVPAYEETSWLKAAVLWVEHHVLGFADKAAAATPPPIQTDGGCSLDPNGCPKP